MKKLTKANLHLAIIAVALVAVSAYAGPRTRKTRITFDGPVRVPGTVLQTGTYFFESPLVNKRTLVRITGEDGSLITQVMGIPDFTRQRNHDVIVFGDHECGPKAIKAWFYPASGTGVRFVYPREEAEAIAAACNEAVPEMHETKLEPEQLQNYTIYLVTPQKEEHPYKADELSATDAADQSGFDGQAAQETTTQNPVTPH
jgi:hypothetical protein